MTSDNFQVVRHPFTMREAIDEAKRCLHCKVTNSFLICTKESFKNCKEA